MWELRLREIDMRRAVHIRKVVHHIDKALTNNRIRQVLIFAITQLGEGINEISHNSTIRFSDLEIYILTILGRTIRVVFIHQLKVFRKTPIIHPRCVVRKCVFKLITTLLLCLGCKVFLGHIDNTSVTKPTPRLCTLTAKEHNERQKSCKNSTLHIWLKVVNS